MSQYTGRALLRARLELAIMGTEQDECRALHYAVLGRSAGVTRLLMRHGADARAGVYPHREATPPLTIAEERGYDDIVAVIREEEQRRREAHAGKVAAAPDEVFLVRQLGERSRARNVEGGPGAGSFREPEWRDATSRGGLRTP